jgi:hypothetical protein
MEQILEKESLATRGRRFYEQHLKALLEPADNGKFLAIEPDSGQYFIGADRTSVALEALSQMPDKLFFLMRVGFPAVDKLGAYGRRKGQS